MSRSSLFAFIARSLIVLVGAFFGVMNNASTASAAWRGYDGAVVTVQAPARLTVGAVADVRVTMRNTGNKAWLSTGKEYVSLYHWDPATKLEAPSSLAAPSWEKRERPMRLPLGSIQPGEQVTWAFPIQAPSTQGLYTGEFIVAAEDVAWLKGSRFRLRVQVEGSTNVSPSQNPVAGTVGSTSIKPVYTEDTSGVLQARVTNGGGLSWTVEAGQDLSVRFVFMNTGSAPWTNTGSEGLRLVPIDQDRRLRGSAFWHPAWATKEVITKLGGRVSLGADATMVFSMRAPDVPGVYLERFALVTESGKQVAGSLIELPITVNAGTGFVATDVSDLGTAAPVPQDQIPAVPRSIGDGALRAQPQSSAATSLTLLGNGRQQVTIGWKNTGATAWNRMGVRLVSSEPWVRASWASDSTWSDGRPPESTVIARPQDMVFYSFYVKAPPKIGTYAFTYRLFANGSPVDGGDILVSVRVTSNGVVPTPDVPSKPLSPVTPSSPPPVIQPPLVAQPLGGDLSILPNEPSIRVGIYQPPHNQLQVRPLTSSADVRLSGAVVCSIQQGQTVTVTYDRVSGTYALSGSGGCSGTSRTPYVVRASDGVSPLEIADFVRPSTWISNASDNDFRSQLELRVSNDQREVWVINELPIEAYLKGIAETSNVSPPEFQRTLLVAARTYAMYHVARGTKHANRGFIVEGTLDQVYRGYQMELRAPNIVAAVDATRGQIVTYAEKLAITPYFSRSDGRTRSWGEVWAGGSSYPWLMSVPVPEDQGRTLWGHGVGMSASGALSMANNGKTYEQILKHFYTGIELRRAYR